MLPSFMRTNSKFSDIQEMFNKGEFNEAGEEEVREVLEPDAWNTYVCENTSFASWPDMLEAAAKENIKSHFNS